MALRSESRELSGARRFSDRVEGHGIGVGRLKAALISRGSPGPVLRDVRVGRLLDLEDISALLGVRAEYIEAVVTDQGEQVLGPNRAMKLAVEYAETLGLEVQVIEDWFAGQASEDDHDDPSTPVTRQESRSRVSLLFDESRHARAAALGFGHPVPEMEGGLRLRRFGVLLLLVGVLLSPISLYPQLL